ncbi:MAG: KxxxW-cyclized peptide pheromone [Patescibacteria group bacterium]|jgi:KxxxW-cyclized secreted peptide|nr:KxxxW-cyclized peptide pheromone [Patescibacteria group bacterium]
MTEESSDIKTESAESPSKTTSTIKRIKNSSDSYDKGGVFEASKFAKGDGWSN